MQLHIHRPIRGIYAVVYIQTLGVIWQNSNDRELNTDNTMKVYKKHKEVFPKRLNELLGIVTIVLALGTFITGNSDLKSFLQDITLLNFLLTIAKTIISYLLAPSILIFSTFIIFDFPLLIFGLDFPIKNLLWDKIFNPVIIEWWWNSSLPENIFLSIVLIYLISCYRLELKNYIINIFYIKISNRWYQGANVAVVEVTNLGSIQNDVGITIGLLLVERKNFNEKANKKLHPTKNIVHLEDSTKYEDDSNK